MTQNDLHRAIARATGETVTEITRRGFQPLDPQLDGSSGEKGRATRRRRRRSRRRVERREPVAA